jgi:hypothetical protein
MTRTGRSSRVRPVALSCGTFTATSAATATTERQEKSEKPRIIHVHFSSAGEGTPKVPKEKWDLPEFPVAGCVTSDA